MHALVTWTEFKLTSDSDQWLVRRFLSGLCSMSVLTVPSLLQLSLCCALSALNHC